MQGDGEEGTEGVPAFTAAAGSDSADHGEERGKRESPGFEDTAPPTSIGGSSSVPRISSDTMRDACSLALLAQRSQQFYIATELSSRERRQPIHRDGIEVHVFINPGSVTRAAATLGH